MREVEKTVSNFIEAQFPEFYREEGPIFVLFIKEYYKWLETFYTYAELEDDTGFDVGNTVVQGSASGSIESKIGKFILIRNTGSDIFKCKIYCAELIPIISSSGKSTYINTVSSPSAIFQSRKLLDNRDLDKTADFFLFYFKEKYLKGVQFTSLTNRKNLIKAALDLYRSKGSERSVDLIFKLVFGTGAEIYYPGLDILKPSDGKWFKPYFLETTKATRNSSFVGKEITGSLSGATAFVESVITRNIKNKIIDVFYLSNLKGNFIRGERISDDGTLKNTPKVTGSLTSVNLTLSGSGFKVGEIVELVSTEGVNGKAVVKEIISETGVVRFSLVDGGWGFAVNASSLVSNKVIDVTNKTNVNTAITDFELFETVSQNLESIGLTDITWAIEKNDIISNPSGSNGVVTFTNIVTDANSGIIIVNTTSGNTLANSSLRISNKQIIVTNNNIKYPDGTVVNQANSSGGLLTRGVVNTSANVTVLTINATPSITGTGFHIGQYVIQSGSGAAGVVSATPYTSYHGFTNVTHIALKNVTGTFNNTGALTAYPSQSNLTSEATATPNTAVLGYQYFVDRSAMLSSGNSQWFTGNTISNNNFGNTTIIISTNVGGKIANNSNVTATANIMGKNTTSYGLINLVNTFYDANNNVIRGMSSNTTGSVTFVSTGTGANVGVGSISDSETVRLALDLISSNNFGLVKYRDLLVTGSNSNTKFGFVTDVLVEDGGTGYDNTDIITFTGGFGSPGSGVGNASITTDSSGIIQNVLLTDNVGTNVISTPAISIVNSSAGSSNGSGATLAPIFSLGFLKLPAADLNSHTIYQMLRFDDYTIGTIAGFKNINPGENYNAAPFITFIQPEVAGYERYDFILNLSSTNGAFEVDESVTQTTATIVGQEITGNTITGNTDFTDGERAVMTDGIRTIGDGLVVLSTNTGADFTVRLSSTSGSFTNTIVTSKLTVSNTVNFRLDNTVKQGSGASEANGTVVSTNSTVIIIKNVNGTFQVNSTPITSSKGGNATITSVDSSFKIFKLTGQTSNATIEVTNTSTFSYTSIARGIVRAYNPANNTLVVRGKTLFADFNDTPGNRIVGISSGANAEVTNATYDYSSNVAGFNSIVSANVTTSEGALSRIEVIDSGFGYTNGETVSIVSNDSGTSATGTANVINQGVTQGTYLSTDSFLSDNKYIHDGLYYQEYSYEVQSSLPLYKYTDILKEVLHVAGTKLFGRVKTASVSSNIVSVSNSSITIS